MNGTIARAARVAALGAACAVGAAPAGCGKSEERGAERPAQPQPGQEMHSYTVRGIVKALPSDASDLMVQHEAIPEFVRADGSLGMDTMTMAFWPPAGIPLEEARVKDLDLSGIEVGDKVALTFEVVHDAQTGAMKGYYATKVEELPEETELDFSRLPPRESPAR